MKTCANSNKLQQKAVREEALFYEKQLREEIDEDRAAHGKKPLKEKDDDNDDDPSEGADGKPEKEIKANSTIRTAGGFTKESTNRYLPTRLKPHVMTATFTRQIRY